MTFCGYTQSICQLWWHTHKFHWWALSLLAQIKRCLCSPLDTVVGCGRKLFTSNLSYLVTILIGVDQRQHSPMTVIWRKSQQQTLTYFSVVYCLVCEGRSASSLTSLTAYFEQGEWSWYVVLAKRFQICAHGRSIILHICCSTKFIVHFHLCQ